MTRPGGGGGDGIEPPTSTQLSHLPCHHRRAMSRSTPASASFAMLDVISRPRAEAGEARGALNETRRYLGSRRRGWTGER